MTDIAVGPQPRHGDPEITPELVAEHKLSEYEYALILEVLGRVPTYTELGVFSAMWSEHCGYKNSKPLLRKLPTEAPWVLQGPGENAGVIDVGDGLAVAFKIESHNHPSAVEPYQGAATAGCTTLSPLSAEIGISVISTMLSKREAKSRKSWMIFV